MQRFPYLSEENPTWKRCQACCLRCSSQATAVDLRGQRRGRNHPGAMTFHDSFGYFECVARGRCGLTWSILGQCLPWMAVHSNESIPGVGNPAQRHLRREPARQLRHIRSLTAPPPIYHTSFPPFIVHFNTS